MDPLWLLVAFFLGWIVRQIGLPPLVGFLTAGFILGAVGVEAGEMLYEVSDLGISLLLFTIGLKLELKSLKRPEIWAGTTLHTIATVTAISLFILLLSAAGISAFTSLSAEEIVLISFALSFSSTVFAVKVLEEHGRMATQSGRTAIGILIIQDILAVLFLTFASGDLPSLWALAVVAGLALALPLFHFLLTRSGHGELLILFGITLALTVSGVFDLVGLKDGLGALVAGLLISRHSKSEELAKAMLAFKDLFLIGFFLEIGLSGPPDMETISIAALLTAVLLLKPLLFFAVLTRFRLKSRAALVASLSLGTYSEFGMLVIAFTVERGWLGTEWLTAIALALAASFLLLSPFNSRATDLYRKYRRILRRFESDKRLPEDLPIYPGEATVLICGLGMVGTGAFDSMKDKYGNLVLGVDFDAANVERHKQAGRNVIFGDATDFDFWKQIEFSGINLILLSIPNHIQNMVAVESILALGFKGVISATAMFDDEVEELRQAGVDTAFNFYSEAGKGFADHICLLMEENRTAPERRG